MRILRRAMVGAAAAVLTAGLLTVISESPAQAHGAMQVPGSRTWLCYVDGKDSTGQIVPKNAGCAAAVNSGGANALYNWFGVLRSDGAGRMRGFIPDGKLCSGGNPTYSGFDLPRSAGFPETHLTAGSTIQIRYNNWARHPGTFRLYITRDGWSQNSPLSWSDLEGVPSSGAGGSPFDSVTNPAETGGPGSDNGYYYWNARLPSGKSGKHIIYSVWHRSDSEETFYNCSDVVFDGGNGEVTGIGGNGQPNPGQTTTPPNPGQTTTPPNPGQTTNPPNPGNGACSASFTAASTWSGGYQGTVTVSNTGSASINGWTVTLNMGSATINNLWNGTASGTSGNVTVRNAAYNGSLGAGASTSFGFVANGSGTPTVSCSAA